MLTQGNDLGAYDFGDPKSPTYQIAVEQRAAQVDEDHDSRSTRS